MFAGVRLVLFVDDQFHQRRFTWHPDPQRETVKSGAAVNVQSVGTQSEKSVVGPWASRKHGPVEAKAHEPNLTAMGVSGKNEINRARFDVSKAQRIMQHE